MESNYNNREFEQFLKQNADQYRMFPSEKVWKGIDNALHTRRRWYGFGLALLLLLTGAGVTWVMITTPENKNQPTLAEVISQANAAEKDKPVTAPQTITKKTTRKPSVPLVYRNTTSPIENNNGTTVPFQVQPQESFTAANEAPAVIITVAPAERTSLSAAEHKPNTPVIHIPVNNPVTIAAARTDKPAAEEIPYSPESERPRQTEVKESLLSPQDKDYPLTIESVVNSYQRPKEKKRITWQIFIAPTISYRKLSENKAFLREAAASGNVPSFAAYNDVKNVVTHKPDIGLEVGMSARYALSRRLTVKAGLQFNISRYDIRAYTYPTEIATIALDDGNNSISTIARYRNFSGNRNANWLQNLYYSVSLPVGAEFKLSSNRADTYFGVGATAQPTYILSDRAYLLTTDYKNYVEVPGLTRRWNLNTSFEMFVGYSSNRYRWQIGPQVRYQTQSSFKNKYPVKENLFDFGLKVGIMFNQ